MSFNKIFQIIHSHGPLYVVILEISDKNFLRNKFNKKAKALGIRWRETIISNFKKMTIQGINIII